MKTFSNKVARRLNLFKTPMALPSLVAMEERSFENVFAS